jgi:hypothetical protein
VLAAHRGGTSLLLAAGVSPASPALPERGSGEGNWGHGGGRGRQSLRCLREHRWASGQSHRELMAWMGLGRGSGGSRYGICAFRASGFGKDPFSLFFLPATLHHLSLSLSLSLTHTHTHTHKHTPAQACSQAAHAPTCMHTQAGTHPPHPHKLGPLILTWASGHGSLSTPCQ